MRTAEGDYDTTTITTISTTYGPLENNPLWQQDHITLVCVGIDIGSSGTQVIFSRDLAAPAWPRTSPAATCVVKRETLYQSPVALTPYQSETRIDEGALGAIIDEAYYAAGLHPDKIDTGAVILTGEALRRENAKAIADLLSDQGGEFVCATAGHHMESMLAAYGSGAARASHDSGKRVLNVDIGGGTTKLAVLEGGKVVGTAAMHIGGRLVVVDQEIKSCASIRPASTMPTRPALLEAGRLCRPPCARTCRGMDGRCLGRGNHRQADAARDRGSVAHRSLASLWPDRGRHVLRRRWRVRLSARDARFRRHGMLLGRPSGARSMPVALSYPLLPAGECIRATAIGASE